MQDKIGPLRPAVLMLAIGASVVAVSPKALYSEYFRATDWLLKPPLLISTET